MPAHKGLSAGCWRTTFFSLNKNGTPVRIGATEGTFQYIEACIFWAALRLRFARQAEGVSGSRFRRRLTTEREKLRLGRAGVYTSNRITCEMTIFHLGNSVRTNLFPTDHSAPNPWIIYAYAASFLQ